MKIRHIGHAGFIVEAAGARILIDPWFNPGYGGTWRPNPDNSHLRREIAFGDYGALYVSHGHEDHFDRSLLLQLGLGFSRMQDVVCASWLNQAVEDVGARPIPWLIRSHPPQLRATVIADDWRQDSMLLIEAEGERVLFANDCNTDRCEWPKNIDVLACQFSGACYYPTAYDYPPAVMAVKIAAFRRGLVDMLVEKIKLCGAKAYIPCSGPCVILGQQTGPGTPFPVWDELESEVLERCPGLEIRKDGVLMAEGDVIIRKETVSFAGYVEFRFPAWLHRKVEAGELTFEDALSTQCVRIHRDPDRFDPALMYPLRGRAVEPA